MADDFADRFTTPVVHVRWWGSYMNGTVPPAGGGVRQFLISFESDVAAIPPSPTNPNGTPSHPGTPILSQIVTLGPLAPSSGTFTETNVSPPAAPNPTDGPLFQYNAELKTPFFETLIRQADHSRTRFIGSRLWPWPIQTRQTLFGAGTTAIGSIPDRLASVMPAVSPGENIQGNLANGQAVWHFQDDAVSGSVVVTLPTGTTSPTVQQTGFVPQKYIDGVEVPGTAAAPDISRFSKDLSFELFTPVPEPATVVLLGLGGVALVAARWRRNRQ